MLSASRRSRSGVGEARMKAARRGSRTASMAAARIRSRCRCWPMSLIGLRAELPDALAYDEMLCAPMLMQPLAGENDFAPRPLTDVDVGIIQEQLQQLGLSRIGKDVDAPGRRHARQRARLPPDPRLPRRSAVGWHRAHGKAVRRLLRCRAGTVCRERRPHVPDQHGGAHLSSRAARPTTCR